MTTATDDTYAESLAAVARGYHAPHAVIAAERQIIGAAICNTRDAEAATDLLTPDDFYDPQCRVVFEALAGLVGSGIDVSETAVLNALLKAGNGALVEQAHLHEFLGARAIGGPGTIAYFAHIVADDATRRRAHIALVQGIGHTAGHDFETADIDTIVGRIQQAAGDRRDGGALYVGDDLDELFADLARPDTAAITTPWPDLDRLVQLRPGQLVVVAARPGAGKSIFGGELAAHRAIHHGEAALVNSLEMPRSEMQKRLLAAEAKVNLSRLTDKQLTEADWTRLHEARQRIRNAPLAIDDTPTTTLAHIRARIRWMQQHHPVTVVVVDYLQLMRPTTKGERREMEVAEFTRGLKLLARDLEVCVIALAQLNRGPEQRTDKRPVMSDLRESGAIENDADIVILIHHEAGDQPDHHRIGEVDLIVAKQRNGPKNCVVPLAFQGHYARMMPLALDAGA